MAGVPGFEPGLSVLETDVLTVDTIPLCRLANADSNCRLPFLRAIKIEKDHELSDCLAIGIWQSAMANHLSLGFFMASVLAATTTKLLKFQPIGGGLLILCRHVIPTFAILTLKHNIIAWHNLFPISDFRLPFGNRQCL